MLLFAAGLGSSQAQGANLDRCPRPGPGGEVSAPADLRSHDGVLRVDFSIRNQKQADGTVRYCYVTPEGTQAPTLRLSPGDELVLRLKDELTEVDAVRGGVQNKGRLIAPAPATLASDPCERPFMSDTSANLHFHGLTLPPVCHQDDVLMTSIQPGDAPFEYQIRVPADEPPGLYWYHAHIHGFSMSQVVGGASGALIIEGIERANRAVAGLPERVLVIRDQDLMHPDASPSKSEPPVPKMLIDRDGDAGNTGTGFGKPAKDLSINFVPVPYPDYPPAVIRMKPGRRELWRVLNASAVTYLNLQVLFARVPQKLGIAAIDGVPINRAKMPEPDLVWVDHIGLPPGARAEFVVEAPPEGGQALFVTRSVDTGPDGENDPNRALASIVSNATAADPPSVLAADPVALPAPSQPWLGRVAPSRVRKLYFSEQQDDPNDPNSPTSFFITEEGKTPTKFDPMSPIANIVVKQGDVEDWIIENRTSELHAFHIHQLHFQLVEWSGRPVNEPFLRDTVNIPYFNGRMLSYPSVRVRMDFRDPNTVGTFVYHCHLLDHEDGGMMGRIRVEPDPTKMALTERIGARLHEWVARLDEAVASPAVDIDEVLRASFCSSTPRKSTRSVVGSAPRQSGRVAAQASPVVELR
ncbi:MAG: multicopper oxidase domain-containing protein [Burkholderiaceae bacterium]